MWSAPHCPECFDAVQAMAELGESKLVAEMQSALSRTNLAPETEVLIKLAIRAQKGEALEALIAELPNQSALRELSASVANPD